MMAASRLHRFVLCLCAVVFLLGVPVSFGAKRGTLKQRQAETSSEDEPATELSSSSTAPLRRGGIRRRALELAEEASQELDPGQPIRDVPLLRNLKKRWGKGELSSTAVQDIAFDAQRSGAKGVEGLSAAGTYGIHRQNLFRDLLKVFGSPVGAPPIDWVELPLKGGLLPHPLIWPHKFFHALSRHRQDAWVDRIVGGPGACQAYWESMRDSAFVRNHPFLPEEGWSNIVPLGLHGDGGAFNKQESVVSIAWNSMVGRGTTVQTRFLFTVIAKSEMTDEALTELQKMLAWSFNVLLSGQTPETDWMHRDLVGGGEDLTPHGTRGVLTLARGDWEWMVQLFGFPRWDAAGDTMCPYCRATNSPVRPWSDFGLGAAWRGTLFTHETYMHHLTLMGNPIPILFALAIGFRIECATIDVLHCVDQGIGSHIVANILWLIAIVRACFGGATYKDRMERCNKNLKEWYKTVKCKSRLQGPLTLQRVRPSGDWPKLRAKAAQTRHLARYALHLISTFGNFESLDEWTRTHDQLALGVCQMLVRFYQLLDSEAQFVSDAAKAEFKDVGNNLGGMYARLAAMAFARELKMWKTSQKHHQWMHLCVDQIVNGNPKNFWCYGDEDLVRIMIGISHSVHPRTLSVSVLCKWLWCVFD
jgi:hypothetical protein